MGGARRAIAVLCVAIVVVGASACDAGIDLPRPPAATSALPCGTPPPVVSPATTPPDRPASPAPASASPTAPATATPGPTERPWAAMSCPTYDDGYDPDYVTIDVNRYASVCLGMSFEEATASLPGATIVGEEMCPWYALVVDADPLYIAAISRVEAPGDEIRALRVLYAGDLSALEPWEVPRTATGIGLGSSRDAVEAAYPASYGLTVDDPSRGPRDQVVVPHETGLAFVFDVVDGTVTEMTWGAGLLDGIAGELCAG